MRKLQRSTVGAIIAGGTCVVLATTPAYADMYGGDNVILSGILVRTNLDETTYLDATGALFTVATPDVAERRPLVTSIMPAGLPDLLTDQELRDLVAYLDSRR